MKEKSTVIVPKWKKWKPLTAKQRRNIAQRQAHFELTKNLGIL